MYERPDHFQTTCRKTSTYTLQPTPAPERALERVVMRCRRLYHGALDQRSTAWQRCHSSVWRYQQEAELKAIRAALPAYAALHRHVLQDVLARLDKTYQACFRRGQRGKPAGSPRCKGRERFHSCPDKECGNGARLENGSRVRSQMGRLAVRWSRPLAGT